MTIYQNFTQAVGRTPLVRLRRLEEFYGCKGRLYAKCEFLNPSGSAKDRAARGILEHALSCGRLQPGALVVCLSGGRGGISCAMVCAALGLRCTVVATDNITLQNMRHIRAFGAEVRMTAAKDGLEGMQQKARAICAQNPGSFLLDQFGDEHASLSHRNETGPELLEDLPDPDHLIAGVGTGATLTGCAEYIKRQRPECTVVAVEPYDSPVLSGGLPGPHPLTGIGLGFVPDTLNPYIIDRVARVRTPDALTMADKLAELEGMLCGPSSGAALTAAVAIAQQESARDRKLAVILPDRGEAYLK